MAAHITSPNEPFPSPDSLAQVTTSHKQGSFTISTRKLPISKAEPIDAMSSRIGIPIPEMIFGDNLVSIRHDPTGWCISFQAEDALDLVDKTDKNMLQVAYAQSWSRSREQTSAGIKEVVKPFDWSYSTNYKGTMEDGSRADGGKEPPPPPEGTGEQATVEAKPENRELPKGFTPSTTPIPLELLKRRDPILFFDDVVLFESELDDNGISVLSVKVRVHAARMLLLSRFFMRLDNVVVRIRDTRVYVDFETEEVTREYTEREAKYEDVKRGLLRAGYLPDNITVAMRDPNQLANVVPLVDGTLEHIEMKA